MHHLGDRLLKSFLLSLWSLIVSSGLVVGELNDLVPHAFTVLLDVGNQLRLLRFEALWSTQLAARREDLGKRGGFDSFHLLGAILRADELAHPAETTPDCRVEIVLNGVVSPI